MNHYSYVYNLKAPQKKYRWHVQLVCEELQLPTYDPKVKTKLYHWTQLLPWPNNWQVKKVTLSTARAPHRVIWTIHVLLHRTDAITKNYLNIPIVTTKIDRLALQLDKLAEKLQEYHDNPNALTQSRKKYLNHRYILEITGEKTGQGVNIYLEQSDKLIKQILTNIFSMETET